MPSSQEADGYRLEFLPEVQDDANNLSDELRRAIARIVVELHSNPWMGEVMDDRWPSNLQGSRKIRFDTPGWRKQPRYRFVFRNEPADGAVGTIVVLAIGERKKMIAYANASARLARRLGRRSLDRR